MIVAALVVVCIGVTAMVATERPATTSRARVTAGEAGPASEAQIRALVDEYGALMYRVAYAITHDRALAEDVVQDAMFQAWTSMPSWEGDQPVRWLRRVTRNRAISVMRKERRSTPSDRWTGHVDPSPDTERIVEGRELVDAVHLALEQLDASSRTMIVLRETEDLSYDEIGAVMNLTPAAVKTKLYRARKSLKDTLEEWELG